MENSESQDENLFLPRIRRPIPRIRRPIAGPENNGIKANELLPRYMTEPAGFWLIYCDNVIKDDNGMTEMDRIWAAAKELVEEEVFIQATYFKPDFFSPRMNTSMVNVHCYIKDYSDIEDVIKSATELRKKVYYPFPLYMKTCDKKKSLMQYLFCVDGDLYADEKGFHIIKRSSLPKKE